MADSEPYTDVMELCVLLECLGFSVKSLDSSDTNLSQEGGWARTVVVNCQASGLHVVLESPGVSCTCPTQSNQQNSGLWQVSGVAGGKQLDREFGCSLLGPLPKPHRDRLSNELQEMIRCIREHGDEERLGGNKSASMNDIKTPEKMLNIAAETPTRYRSLDTLTGKSVKKEAEDLPEPGVLQRPHLISESELVEDTSKKMVGRQSTYTLSSTPGSTRRKNKTSSPIHLSQITVLDTLLSAQKATEEVQIKLSSAIRKLTDEVRDDSSMSSLALDVSKIPVLKAPDNSRAHFASSPNLSGVVGIDDSTKNRLKRCESVSTSNLDPKSGSKGKPSRLRRISPSFFKKETSLAKDKIKSQDGKNKSKLQSLFKPKIVTPVRTPLSAQTSESSPSLSTASRNKYSHIKSTIPRAVKKE